MAVASSEHAHPMAYFLFGSFECPLPSGEGGVLKETGEAKGHSWHPVRDCYLCTPLALAIRYSPFKGSRTVKAEPTPSSLSTLIVPPCCSTTCRALASPIPVPLMRPDTLPALRNHSKM